MMMLNINILKLIILENASVVASYDENPTQNVFLTAFVAFSVGASIRKPFEEPTFEQTTNIKKKSIPLLNRCPLLLNIGLELY
jgi:hypothetical protein